MESFDQSVVEFHVTGFTKFFGVPENPTEWLIANISEKLESIQSNAFQIKTCTVLQTAGRSAFLTLEDIIEKSRLNLNTESKETTRKVVWVHFGVFNGSKCFFLERRAYNEANFSRPDELGWQPLSEQIYPEDGPTWISRETKLPLEEVESHFEGSPFKVQISEDAGRFVCNYVYYQSLKLLEEASGTLSLFVHVPMFTEIDRQTQLNFIAELFTAIAKLC